MNSYAARNSLRCGRRRHGRARARRSRRAAPRRRPGTDDRRARYSVPAAAALDQPASIMACLMSASPLTLIAAPLSVAPAPRRPHTARRSSAGRSRRSRSAGRERRRSRCTRCGMPRAKFGGAVDRVDDPDVASEVAAALLAEERIVRERRGEPRRGQRSTSRRIRGCSPAAFEGARARLRRVAKVARTAPASRATAQATAEAILDRCASCRSDRRAPAGRCCGGLRRRVGEQLGAQSILAARRERPPSSTARRRHRVRRGRPPHSARGRRAAPDRSGSRPRRDARRWSACRLPAAQHAEAVHLDALVVAVGRAARVRDLRDLAGGGLEQHRRGIDVAGRADRADRPGTSRPRGPRPALRRAGSAPCRNRGSSCRGTGRRSA